LNKDFGVRFHFLDTFPPSPPTLPGEGDIRLPRPFFFGVFFPESGVGKNDLNLFRDPCVLRWNLEVGAGVGLGGPSEENESSMVDAVELKVSVVVDVLERTKTGGWESSSSLIIVGAEGIGAAKAGGSGGGGGGGRGSASSSSEVEKVEKVGGRSETSEGRVMMSRGVAGDGRSCGPLSALE
jgi:hypothetical protein